MKLETRALPAVLESALLRMYALRVTSAAKRALLVFTALAAALLLTSCKEGASAPEAAATAEDQKRGKFLEPLLVQLKDPESARYRNLRFSTGVYGESLCGEVNAKNSLGGYTGYSFFAVTERPMEGMGRVTIVPVGYDFRTKGLEAVLLRTKLAVSGCVPAEMKAIDDHDAAERAKAPKGYFLTFGSMPNSEVKGFLQRLSKAGIKPKLNEGANRTELWLGPYPDEKSAQAVESQFAAKRVNALAMPFRFTDCPADLAFRSMACQELR